MKRLTSAAALLAVAQIVAVAAMAISDTNCTGQFETVCYKNGLEGRCLSKRNMTETECLTGDEICNSDLADNTDGNNDKTRRIINAMNTTSSSCLKNEECGTGNDTFCIGVVYNATTESYSSGYCCGLDNTEP